VHNWLSGHLWLRLYANGVIEVFARHINSKYVDDGLDLPDVVPVLGVACDDPGDLVGTWDGSRESFELAGASWDVREVSRLATPDRPGQVSWDNGWLALQPYMGVEVYSGVCARDRLGDTWIWKAEQRMFPRGMARTLRFSLSLGDRSPRIVRYLPPYWWYGLTGEIQHTPYLPVANKFDAALDHLRQWLHTHILRGGFEDGAIPRGAPLPVPPDPTKRYEAGWEGDAPHGMFMLAFRTGDGDDYHNALRNTYHFTDVAVDHAARLVRMHGYPPVAFAQPGHRVIGTIMGYLETGDPYLLDTAESVVENAFRCHRNSWPRLAVGRDACFVRGAVMLYRYLNSVHFRDIARETARNVAHSQRANGSFGDQGGGAGIHAWGAYITKPWMAMLATTPLLDYLELFPDEPELRQCVQRTGDWLLSIRFAHDDGSVGWSYQHDFNDGPDFYDFRGKKWTKLPGTKSLWHMDNLGRLLAACSLLTGDGVYFDAWAESAAAAPKDGGGDHSVAASLLLLPRMQTWLWQPRWTEDGIVIKPFHYGERTPREGTILAPDGQYTVRWRDDGTPELPPGVRLAVSPP